MLIPILLLLAELQPVPKVDLQRYSGIWYEFARLPNRFQKDCAGDVRAEYTLNPDRTLRVVNRCRVQGKGAPKVAEGAGRVAKEDKGSNSILEVRFAPAFLSFLPVWGDYRIIALDADYQYAMVGSKDLKYLWILSRAKSLPDSTYQRLLANAARQGFRTAQVVPTPQQ